MTRTRSASVVVALGLLASLVLQPALSGVGFAAGGDSGTRSITLTNLSNEIFAKLSAPGGDDVSYTGVDAETNIVEIGLVNYTPGRARDLARQYGASRVRIVPSRKFHTNRLLVRKRDGLLAAPKAAPMGVGPYCDRTFCIPTRGGVYLQQDAGDGEHIWICSATIVGTNRAARPATLTAGHCFTRDFPIIYGTMTPPWVVPAFLTGAELGWVGDAQFLGSSDHAVIPWTAPSGAYGWDYLTNCVFVPGVDCQRESFNASDSDIPIGTEITQSGVTTGRTGGRVVLTSTNANVVDEGIVHQLTDLVLTSACSLPGDSGGTVFSGVRLIGTISAGNWRDTNPPSCDPNPRTLVAKSVNAFYNLGFSARLIP